MNKPVFTNLDLVQLRLNLIRNINTETVSLQFHRESETVGHGADSRSLHKQRDDSNKKHCIEYHVGILNAGNPRIRCKDYRYRTAQSNPRHIYFSFGCQLSKRSKTQ